jgi:hypothetical protein
MWAAEHVAARRHQHPVAAAADAGDVQRVTVVVSGWHGTHYCCPC